MRSHRCQDRFQYLSWRSANRDRRRNVLGARTLETNSICTNALTAIHPMNLAMRLTNKMYWEKKDHFDIVCPTVR